MGTNLDRVEQALEKKNASAALAAMLDAWRENRAPGYADAIDALSAAVAGSAKLDTHEAWMDRALENNPDDVGALVDALLVGKLSTLGGRVEHLAARPDDPRIATAFAKASLEPPMTSSSNFSVWTKIYDAMTRSGDTRIVPTLEARLAQPQGPSKFWPRHYAALEKVLAKLRKVPVSKTTGDEKKRLLAIAKSAKGAERVAAAPAKKKAATKAKGEPLERAAAAAEAGEWRDCLGGLLDAWRPLRIAPLGHAIDRVSAILEDGRPPPFGKKLTAAWAAMAERNDVADIGLLAQSSSDPKAVDAESCMDRMTTWAEDPRIGKAMIVKALRASFSDRTRAWQLVGTLLLRNADERVRAEVERLHRTDNKARNGFIGRMTKELLPQLAKITGELGPVDVKLLARVNAAVDAFWASDLQTERKFLADIAADPESDGPRLVYADWLTERGHPRGELIVLQCAERAGTATPKQLARITALLETAGRAIVGPIANALDRSVPYALKYGGTVIDRGLVREINLAYTPSALDFEETPLPVLERVVNAPSGQALAALAKSAPNLRRGDNADISALRALSSLPEPATVEELRVRYRDEELTGLTRLGGAGLSKLRSFGWTRILPRPRDGKDRGDDAFPEAVFAAPFVTNAERVSTDSVTPTPILAALKKNKAKTKRLTLGTWDYSFGFKLDIDLAPDLTPRAVTIDAIDPERGDVLDKSSADWLFFALEQLGAPQSRAITVAPGIQVDPAVQTKLNAITAKWKSA